MKAIAIEAHVAFDELSVLCSGPRRALIDQRKVRVKVESTMEMDGEGEKAQKGPVDKMEMRVKMEPRVKCISWVLGFRVS